MATNATKPATPPYDADALNKRLIAALDGAVTALVFSGPPGSGKSTLLAGAPVAAGKTRRIFDHENSMKMLDAGPDGTDLYTPRHQKFRMNRTKFPRLEEYATLYTSLKAGNKDGIGVVVIDNIKLLQDQLAEATAIAANNPAKLREFYGKFDAANTLPFDSIIKKWAIQRDAAFWSVLKGVFRNLLLECARQDVSFFGSTEEGILWEGYGTSNQTAKGKKAKILDVWYSYTDAVVFLKRDVNKGGAPVASINPNQPKVRIQGLNPSWVMDWPSFVTELEVAKTRRDEAIPAETHVTETVLSEGPEISEPSKPAQQA